MYVNGAPQYQLVLQEGINRHVFGEGLDPVEQEWLAGVINEHLGGWRARAGLHVPGCVRGTCKDRGGGAQQEWLADGGREQSTWAGGCWRGGGCTHGPRAARGRTCAACPHVATCTARAPGLTAPHTFACTTPSEENRGRLRELGGFVGGSERALPAGGATAGAGSGRPFADFVSPAAQAQRQAAMAEQAALRAGRQAERAGKKAAAEAERAGRMAAADAKRARPLGGSRFQQRRQQQQDRWDDDVDDKWNL